MKAGFLFLDNVCLSGGANDADLLWGLCAGSLGHAVIHWTFKGARSAAPRSELECLTEAQLVAADPMLHRANLTLQRHFPPRSLYATNLLRRNWYQVETAGSCYGVSTIRNGKVQGGTAWAVQMFIDRFDGAACPCYVFCQDDGRWHEWSGSGWTRIYEPPMPTDIYAGVGTRALNLTGKLAIRTVMRWDKRAAQARLRGAAKPGGSVPGWSAL